MIMNLKFVRVKWKDARIEWNEEVAVDGNGEQWENYLRENIPIEESFGYLVYENDEGYVLASQITREYTGKYKSSDFVYIPKHMAMGNPKKMFVYELGD